VQRGSTLQDIAPQLAVVCAMIVALAVGLGSPFLTHFGSARDQW